jgi:hypothetical protein
LKPKGLEIEKIEFKSTLKELQNFIISKLVSNILFFKKKPHNIGFKISWGVTLKYQYYTCNTTIYHIWIGI